ncbi:MAG: glucosylceramidase [Lachnospiraceae bacterium]|nr:glucosylceramidase [Lachnospiraceae bacterium]
MKIVQSVKENRVLWAEKEIGNLGENYNFDQDTIRVDSSEKYQQIIGFGGAFTEAAAYTLKNTSEENQKEIIKAYFDKEDGIGYNIGRTTIHGCDFSLEPYTYVEEGDYELKTFDMSRDYEAIIPMIKMAEESAGHKLCLLASPWSPPAFMKDSKDINHGGELLKENYGYWAKYMVKYIKQMRAEGFDINMVSVQNEPQAVQTWASCIYDATQEAEFACDYLYEELKKEGLADKVKIIIWDHNRDIIYRRVKESMSYDKSDEKIWGVAYHWYCCNKSENLAMVHKDYPNLHLIFTEGCVELVNVSGSTSSKEGAGAWTHGETYGRNIINDMNNFCEGWIDWNLLLNEQGGPNYVGNFCEAPIMVDRNENKVLKNVSYFYIGHFSKYIQHGATRIDTMNDVEFGLYTAAFKNPDGSIVVVAQHESEEERKVALVVDGKGVDVILPAHSITTFII